MVSHFVDHISAVRPAVLFMDSHASHLSSGVLEKASQENIHLVIFPSHTTHLLQPLNVSIYKALKHAFQEQVKKFMVQHPGEKPTRLDFNSFLTPSYLSAFVPSNIINSFMKTGIFPLNSYVISDESLAPSALTKPDPHHNAVVTGE